MTNRNTASKAGYILKNIFWALLFMFFYSAVLFYPLPGCSSEDSKLALWILVLVLCATGVIVTFKRRRNDTSTLANTILPFELYALVTYYRFFPKAVLGVSVLSVILALLFFVGVLMQKKSRFTGHAVRLSKRIWHGILGSRVIVTVCLLLFIVPVSVCTIFEIPLYTSNVGAAVSQKEDSEWTISNKIDTLKLLEENNWAKLDTQERLDVLNTVVNIEVRYLGINDPITLECGKLEGTVAALYSDDDKRIVIDITYLSERRAHDSLHAICHECYHAYQRQQVELYSILPEEYRDMLMFDIVKEYEKEFADYTKASEDATAYLNQKCEVYAEEYAFSSVDDYYKRIAQYS